MPLGKSYGALGRFDLSVAAFNRALMLSPENVDALLFVGVASASNGNSDESYSFLRQALILSKARKNVNKSKIIINAMHSTDTFSRLSREDKNFLKLE